MTARARPMLTMPIADPVPAGISPTTPYEDLPEYLSPEELRDYLRLGRNTVYDLLRRDAIAHVRFGRTIRIPKASLRHMVQARS
jgi:excisionase family DNA binding protein